MNRHDDLPLFRWTPPKVEVIPFPIAKRTGHVRRIAERIQSSRTDREAEALWKRALDTTVRQMERAGIEEARIEVELAALHHCVGREMQRVAHRPYQPDGERA